MLENKEMKKETRMNKKRNAFTMVELIFVIVIIGILVSIAMPKLSASRDDAKFYASLASLKQAVNNAKAEYLADPVAFKAAQKSWLGKVNSYPQDGPDGACFSVYTDGGKSYIAVNPHSYSANYSACSLDAATQDALYDEAISLGLMKHKNIYTLFYPNARKIRL